MTATLTLRRARPEEDHVVRRLAALDSARPLRGEIYLAVAGDRPVAALSTLDGRIVADPFVPTGEVVGLLREFAAGPRAGAHVTASPPRSAARSRFRPLLGL